MNRERYWGEYLLIAVGLFLIFGTWFTWSKAGSFACSTKIRQALDDSAQIIAAGLARPVSRREQELSFRKGLVPDICSEEQFREIFERERGRY